MSAKAKKQAKLLALKPSQICEAYSIPPSSLHFYCEKMEPAADRLPSYLLPGRNGRKCTRLVRVADLETWLEKHLRRHSAA